MFQFFFTPIYKIQASVELISPFLQACTALAIFRASISVSPALESDLHPLHSLRRLQFRSVLLFIYHPLCTPSLTLLLGKSPSAPLHGVTNSGQRTPLGSRRGHCHTDRVSFATSFHVVAPLLSRFWIHLIEQSTQSPYCISSG